MLNPDQRKSLLQLARTSIESRFNGHEPSPSEDPIFRKQYGVFVSLHKHGELRGCIGYIKGHKALGLSVVEMAQAAAFRDPRFSPVSQDEIPELELEISILGEMIPITGPQDIQIGRDGLLLDHPRGSGLLLPQVAEEWGWGPVAFMQQVCKKAGLSRGSWQDKEARIFRFEAEVFSE
ncbi:MAG TPA: AmmeMemoRadiSam system protein A [Candidatus Cloacimonadota bacterium]|nr:AmmeMemoRadiSam system protein A [Candidatus Cloacimonadota bacterium]